ncbi:MAG TPA: CapA family protein [Candidatus Limnocylindrales bacterium]|nr:CapA family protein [Candidatus Limnocylindrales bacterium]
MGPTIALGGDIMLGRGVAETLAERPPTDVWSPELRAVFAEADMAVVNLECCISERGEPWDPEEKAFHFRAPPRAVEALTAIGVRAVWLANNHALDFGREALADTLDHLADAGIVVIGAGRNLEEARVGRIIEIAGMRIGLVAFADHPDDFAATPQSSGIAWADIAGGTPPWLVDEVRRLSEACDIVIAGPHWGPNMTSAPSHRHRAVAGDLVAAGLGALAGHSAHVVHGIELRGGTPICYDLGDLVDDYMVDPVLRNDFGMLALLRPGERLELVPLRLTFAHTTLAHGSDHAAIVERVIRASRVLGTDLRLEGDRLVLDLRDKAG